MKVYILRVPKLLQPDRQPQRYPAHSKDYGVEQDFHTYLLRNKGLITDCPEKADWHYLPIYWTRWHLNHDYGRLGLEELQHQIDKLMLNDTKTFTICQYDDGPLAQLGQATIFLGARKTEHGRDIPVLCSPHRVQFFRPSKKYLASFVGRLSNHPIREEMAVNLRGRNDVYIFDGVKKHRYKVIRGLERYIPYFPQTESVFFVKKILESYIALCPRGYGGTSMRFFEAMQLGVAPFFIGDRDIRPFRKFIPWDEISLFSSTASDVSGVLDTLSRKDLIFMGEKAKRVFQEDLAYQKWCKYVIQELKELS